MYSLHRDIGVEELTASMLSVWLEIHLYLHTWRYPDRKRRWGDEGYTVYEEPDFNRAMSYKEWIEMRRSLRFEGCDEEHRLAANDRAWKVRPLINIARATLKRVNSAPGQFFSLDEAMMLYTGFRCPIVVGRPNKPISRGIKLHFLVDYETGIIVDFMVHDGSVAPEVGDSFPGGVVGLHVERLLEPLKGSGYVVFLDNFFCTAAIARHLLDRDVRLVGTLRTTAMTDFERIIRFDKSRSMKPSKVNPKGKHKLSRTKDGKIFAIGLMDTRAVYFLDATG